MRGPQRADLGERAAHRKAEHIHRCLPSVALLNVLIEASSQLSQRNSPQTMGQMRGQERTLWLIQGLDQPSKQTRSIPKAMNENQGRHVSVSRPPYRERSTNTRPLKPVTGAAHLVRRNQVGTGP